MVNYVGEVTMPTGSKVTKGAVGRSDNEAPTLQSNKKTWPSRKFCHGGTNDIKQKLEVQGEENINRRRRHCED
ncbi:hypothetical protein J6590_029592 [Homalodisca vitripennis]|nr:hypothetical protein J6590_029592 [Homalodisca vitripennis]